MPNAGLVYREECLLSFAGSSIQENEMDVEEFAQELLHFKQLITQANNVLNRRQKTQVSIKIKGEPISGSLNAKVVIDF